MSQQSVREQKTILTCLSNLAGNTTEDLEQIAKHKIFQFIIRSAHPECQPVKTILIFRN